MVYMAKIWGTLASTFQIGKGGPKIKNNSDIIELRNAADDGFVKIRVLNDTEDSDSAATAPGAVAAMAAQIETATLWMDEAQAITAHTLVRAHDSGQNYYLYAEYGYDDATAWLWPAFPLAAGTYKLYILCVTSTDSPIVDVYLDDVEVDNFDMYSGEVVYNAVLEADITIAASGVHQIKMVVDGKNVASSNYKTRITKCWLEKQ